MEGIFVILIAIKVQMFRSAGNAVLYEMRLKIQL